jgi:hypothetical protein
VLGRFVARGDALGRRKLGAVALAWSTERQKH